MLVSNELSNSIPVQQNETELKTSQVGVSSSLQTCIPTNKESNTKMLKSSRNVALTTLPILNKLPKSSTIGSNLPTLGKFLPSTYSINNSTLNNINLPDLSPKNFTQIMASYNNYSTKNLTSYYTYSTKNTTFHNIRKWPLAGENYPGFKPLGFRTRPTFGEQCLKTGNQWPGPRKEPGPSLPHLDLFEDHPTQAKCFQPTKDDVIVNPVSRFRKNRFPALVDAYNINNGLFTFGRKSRPIVTDFGKKDKVILSSADLPEVTSCKLNKVVKQKRNNSNLSENYYEQRNEVSNEGCLECPLCREEVELQARAGDVNKLAANSPRYHIRLPTTD